MRANAPNGSSPRSHRDRDHPPPLPAPRVVGVVWGAVRVAPVSHQRPVAAPVGATIATSSFLGVVHMAQRRKIPRVQLAATRPDRLGVVNIGRCRAASWNGADWIGRQNRGSSSLPSSRPVERVAWHGLCISGCLSNSRQSKSLQRICVIRSVQPARPANGFAQIDCSSG